MNEMMSQALAVLSLRAGYNSAVVVLGAAALGVAAGTVGTFLLLRRRALLADALSHATLPGIAAAFLAATALGGTGRSLPVLLAGATVSGVLAVLAVQAITRLTRLSEDSAIGAVLSAFFGLGVVLLSVVQGLNSGGQAGLKSFILGQTAAMSRGEAWIMAALALAAAAAVTLLFKEFRVLAFDPGFAQAQGWPVNRLDLALMGLVTLVTVIGLQTVGLVLVVALLIIPAAAARFWTERLGPMAVLAAGFGGVSGWVGASLSALLPGLPAGAVIVLSAGVLFIVSLAVAPARGVVAAAVRGTRLRLDLAESAALGRALAMPGWAPSPPLAGWLALRGWWRQGRLTAGGRAAALAAVRNRRRWDRLLTVAPGQVPPAARWGLDPLDRFLPPDTIRLLDGDGGGP